VILIKNAAQALRIALEDCEMAIFISTHFSRPEQRPEIRSQKWVSITEKGWTWNVILIEKPPDPLREKIEMLNVAVFKIDAQRGKVIKRQFIKNILSQEFKMLVEKMMKDPCILHESCKVRIR
jgi:hypothetical protein